MVGAAVLIGSGPSLNAIDCRRLFSFRSIAFNRSWIAWKDWGFSPSWYGCLDPGTVAAISEDFSTLIGVSEVERFFLHPDAGSFVPPDSRITFVTPNSDPALASKGGDIADFGNVGATSLQILHGLGISKVLMVGVDGYYAPREAGAPDVNHFSPAYTTHSVKGDLDRFTQGWAPALAWAVSRGMDVRNASPGTRMNACPEIDFEQGLAWLSGCN